MGDQLPDDIDDSTKASMRVSAGGQIVADTGVWSSLSSGLTFVSQYGWYVLIVSVMLLYLWNRYKLHYYNWMEKRQERMDEQNFDPVKAERFQDEMMRSRERMQHKLDQEAQAYLLKQEEKKNKEQDERIKQWEQFKVINKSKASRDSRKDTRRDFLPLGGAGGGGGYKPSRRQVSGGGG